jgi:two-component system sensor histidine kinase PilS (NtrC family)
MTAAPVSARDSFWRSLQTLNLTRVVVAAVLLVYLSFSEQVPRAAARFTDAHLCFAYLALACLFALATPRYRHRFLLQLLTQVAVDLVAISLLYMANGGVRSGLAILYLLPLAGAAVLSPLTLALFLVSLVTLFLLLESTYQVLLGGDAPLMQSGLYGAALFTVVLVVSRMASRLIGQEALAARRRRRAPARRRSRPR